MKIEQAIKQKAPFRNARHKAVVNILFTHNWIVSRHREMLRSFDTTLQQYNVLRILRGSYPHPLSTSEIRDRMLDRNSDVSRIVDRLLLKQLVERSLCEDDKRLVDVCVTQQGLDLLSEIDLCSDEMDSLMINLDEEEAEFLSGLLDKLRG